MIFRPVRYAVALVGFSAVIFVLGYLAERYFGVAFSNSGTSIVPVLVASMMEGQIHAAKTSVRPAKQAMWGAAFRMALIALGLSLLPLAVVFYLDPGLGSTLSEYGPILIIGGLVFGFALSWIISRLGYGMGVRSEIKRQERLGK